MPRDHSSRGTLPLVHYESRPTMEVLGGVVIDSIVVKVRARWVGIFSSRSRVLHTQLPSLRGSRGASSARPPALNYRSQGVTGGALREFSDGLKSLNYLATSSGGGVEIRPSELNYHQRPTP